jgi:hypothetical protein
LNKKKILIFGCGNVGSRHLQALTNLPYDLEIGIIEPNNESKKIAKSRLIDSNYDSKKHEIVWHDTINDVVKSYDLAIIATSSVGRVKNIIKLLELGISNFLIEKIVCQSNSEYELLLNSLKKFNAKSWINVNMRYFDAYQKIKESFTNSKIHVSIIGSKPVLGSNAIHYLDFICWLSDSYDLILNGEFLSNEIFLNKRGDDFVEFAGTLIGSGKNFSIVLTYFPDSNLPTTIDIANSENHIVIDELNDEQFILSGNLDFEYKFEHVSTVTTKIVKDIFEKNTCILPSASDLYSLHSELFRVFNDHITKIKNIKPSLCPIT